MPGVFFFTKKMPTVDCGFRVKRSKPVACRRLHSDLYFRRLPAKTLQVYGVMAVGPTEVLREFVALHLVRDRRQVVDGIPKARVEVIHMFT